MSGKIECWQNKPVMNEVVISLIKNRGEMLTTDLYRTLSNAYQDFTWADLNDMLFRMECRGMIYVVPIKKDVSKVEINNRMHFSDEISEMIKKYRGI
jgi:hypothetical protein